MTYAFHFRASTKTIAKALVVEKMTKTARSQACHAIDRDQVIAGARSMIDLLPDDATRDVSIMLSGGLAGSLVEGDVTVDSVRFSITAELVARG